MTQIRHAVTGEDYRLLRIPRETERARERESEREGLKKTSLSRLSPPPPYATAHSTDVRRPYQRLLSFLKSRWLTTSDKKSVLGLGIVRLWTWGNPGKTEAHVRSPKITWQVQSTSHPAPRSRSHPCCFGASHCRTTSIPTRQRTTRSHSTTGLSPSTERSRYLPARRCVRPSVSKNTYEEQVGPNVLFVVVLFPRSTLCVGCSRIAVYGNARVSLRTLVVYFVRIDARACACCSPSSRRWRRIPERLLSLYVLPFRKTVFAFVTDRNK